MSIAKVYGAKNRLSMFPYAFAIDMIEVYIENGAGPLLREPGEARGKA